jgi:hypothetical protein
MARPIDADMLPVHKAYWAGWGASFYVVAKSDIDSAPTIDAVPVVRCAECKYWLCVEDGFGDCTNRRFHLDGCADPSMKMDDFCSCGERRSDD